MFPGFEGNPSVQSIEGFPKAIRTLYIAVCVLKCARKKRFDIILCEIYPCHAKMLKGYV